MLPIADTHVHLLAGLDDGPVSVDEALAMCRMLVAEGARHATALAHQNPDYPDNTATHLQNAAAELAAALVVRQIPLSVYPTGEVMLSVNTFPEWKAGRLLTVGGHGRSLLVEMPLDLFFDVRPLAAELKSSGVRLIIAHAERYPELIFDDELLNQFLAAGCLIQVTAAGLAAPSSLAHERALKNWVKRGIVHLIGSDGHNLERRPPRLRAGMQTLARWAGQSAADRIAGIWSTAILQGKPVNPPAPLPKPRNWFARLFEG